MKEKKLILDINSNFKWKNKNATSAANKVCALCDKNAVAEKIMQQWIAEFKDQSSITDED